MSDLFCLPREIIFDHILHELSLKDFISITQSFKFPFYIPQEDIDNYGVNYAIYINCWDINLYKLILKCFGDQCMVQEYKYYQYVLGVDKSHIRGWINILVWKCAIHFKDIDFLISNNLEICVNGGCYEDDIVFWKKHCKDIRGFDLYLNSPAVFNGLIYAANDDAEIEVILWNNLRWVEFSAHQKKYFKLENIYDCRIKTISFINGKEYTNEQYIEDYFKA